VPDAARRPHPGPGAGPAPRVLRPCRRLPDPPQRRSADSRPAACRDATADAAPPAARAPRVSSEPLEEHIADFWEAGEDLDNITTRITPPPVPQAILKRLGPVPLRDLPEEWYSDLGRMYEVVGRDALAFATDVRKRVPANGSQASNAD